MTPFGYLIVFISLVLALGVTRLLTGVGQLLQATRRHEGVRLYWVHLSWAATVLLMIVNYWWTVFQLRHQEEWLFFQFLALLLAPILFYLQAVVLFPEADRLEGGFDYRSHFYDQHRAFFLFMAGIAVLNFVYSFTDMFELTASVTAPAVAGQSATLLVMVGGILTDNEIYHGIVAALALLFSAGLSIAASGQTAIG